MRTTPWKGERRIPAFSGEISTSDFHAVGRAARRLPERRWKGSRVCALTPAAASDAHADMRCKRLGSKEPFGFLEEKPRAFKNGSNSPRNLKNPKNLLLLLTKR